MKGFRKSRSGLFLMEMIIGILFFSCASAVCIQMFAKAHIRSIETKELNIAVNKAQSVASCIKSGKTSPDALAKLLDMQTDGNTVVSYYDKDWNMTDVAPIYKMKIEFSNKDDLITATINVSKNSPDSSPEGNTNIYTLDVDKYIGND